MIAVLFFMAMPAYANDQATIRALQSIEQGRWSVAQSMIAQISNVQDKQLAAKLFYWLQWTRKDDVENYTRLAQFIRRNPNWPKTATLISKAERSMPANLSNAQIIGWFKDYEPQTAAGLDRYMDALTGTGRVTQAQNLIRKWWAEMSFSRDEQRALYQKYGRLIDRTAHTRRLDNLLFRKQYTNARAIAKVLGAGYPELAEARIALANDKANVNTFIDKVPASLKNDPGLRFERLQWRRKNDLDGGAIEILNIAPNFSDMQNPKEWWRERHIMIRRLLEDKNYRAAYALASGHKQQEGFSFAQAEWLAGWLALRFVNNPTAAYERFTNLHQNVSSPISKARAAYWAGRAADKLNRRDEANSWYQNAAQYQTVFYGQLAGAKLGEHSMLPNAAPPALLATDIQNFERNEMIRAATLFHAAGMRAEASDFIDAFVKSKETPKAYRYASELATNMKRHHDALKIAKDATRKGLFLTAQAYPVVTNRLGNVTTEWALVHAIIRQESMFDYKAQSRVGALGLMQLMPATAVETARKLGISHQKSWLTNRPDHNIRLGSTYLNRMLARYDDSYPMAIAAYNAGPGRVDRWIKDFGDPRTGEVEWIDWIELVPIYETRNYIQRVMEAIYVYRLRLNGIQPPVIDPIHIALID